MKPFHKKHTLLMCFVLRPEKQTWFWNNKFQNSCSKLKCWVNKTKKNSKNKHSIIEKQNVFIKDSLTRLISKCVLHCVFSLTWHQPLCSRTNVSLRNRTKVKVCKIAIYYRVCECTFTIKTIEQSETSAGKFDKVYIQIWPRLKL